MTNRSAPAPFLPSNEGDAPRAHSVRILCVDDKRSNLIALEGALASLGYELTLAQSGLEAIERAKQEEFAAILLDVQMPELDGFETARRIRALEHSSHTPIIFLTAVYPSETYVLQGYEAGAVDYLFKPLNLDILRAKVAVFADLFSAKREIQRQATLLREAERVKQELELAQVREKGERKYQRLVEGIRDGIVWSVALRELEPGARPRFLHVSEQIERITGRARVDWLAEPSLFPRWFTPELLTKLQALADGPDTRASFEHEIPSERGESTWFHSELQLERPTDRREEAQIHGLSVNITHLKTTEKALRKAVAVRDEFLSIASHELKTPITPLQLQMQGFSRLIDTGKISTISIERLRHMLEISNAQVGRLSRLVGQLLDVSRIDEGRLVISPEPSRLSEIAASAIEQLGHELEAYECRTEILTHADPLGHWDRLRLEQVLINLLSNSIKYAPGRMITLELSASADRASVSVADQGLGIAPEDQERIFNRFERAVPLNHYGGLGLGLYISRQIVNLHGGRILVKSALGQGATFTVELPLHPGADEIPLAQADRSTENPI